MQANTRQIEDNYEDAKRQGHTEPVVVCVVDLRDRQGRELAKLDSRWDAGSPEGLERIFADYTVRSQIPTACLALCRPLAVQMLRHFAPGAACHIDAEVPPPGYCWVCVVASGRTLTAQYRGARGGTVDSDVR